MWTRRLVVMIRSTMSPVPSGDPSSTTRTSRRSSCARTVSIRRLMFSRSLYVGTITRARAVAIESTPSGAVIKPFIRRAGVSGWNRRRRAAAIEDHAGYDDADCEEERDERDAFASWVLRIGEGQVDVPGPGGQSDSDQVGVHARDR